MAGPLRQVRLCLCAIVFMLSALAAPAVSFDFTSLRIQTLGSGLSGILEDPLTDLAANPARTASVPKQVTLGYGRSVGVGGSPPFFGGFPSRYSYARSVAPLDAVITTGRWTVFGTGGLSRSGYSSASGTPSTAGDSVYSSKYESGDNAAAYGAAVVWAPRRSWGLELLASRSLAESSNSSTYTNRYRNASRPGEDQFFYSDGGTLDRRQPLAFAIRSGWLSDSGTRELIAEVNARPTWEIYESSGRTIYDYDSDGNGLGLYGDMLYTRLSTTTVRSRDEVLGGWSPGVAMELRLHRSRGSILTTGILAADWGRTPLTGTSDSTDNTLGIVTSTTTTSQRIYKATSRDGERTAFGASSRGGVQYRDGPWTVGAGVSLSGRRTSSELRDSLAYSLVNTVASTSTASINASTTTIRTDSITQRNDVTSLSGTLAAGVEYRFSRVAVRLGTSVSQSVTSTLRSFTQGTGATTGSATTFSGTQVTTLPGRNDETAASDSNSSLSASYNAGIEYSIGGLVAETKVALPGLSSWAFQAGYRF